MEFSSAGGMKSPFSPRVRQSISGRRHVGLGSAKKNQSKFLQSTESQGGDVIYKTPLSTIETYGMPLPVMVTETLTFASGDISVRLSSSGWCWLVAGRRVLAWPYDPQASGTTPGAAPAARELTLPQTDLAHKADLVMLFYEDGAQMPSCIGVSPEGTIRYWASIGQEGAYSDVNAELAGQECERLGQPTANGLVLATTTCTVVLLQPSIEDGRAVVLCRTLRPPSGWLGGLGRRVSLLFFGSMPAQDSAKLLVGVVVLSDGTLQDSSPECGCVALIAGGTGGPNLQVWKGTELYEHNLRRMLAEAQARVHLAPQGDPSTIEIICLDVHARGPSGLLLFIAAANISRNTELRYAIAHISIEEPSSPVVTSIVPLRNWADPALRNCEQMPRLMPLGPRATVYSNRYVAVVNATISNDKVDFIDVSSEGDRILGAELCNGLPLLFSKKHGVLVLSTYDSLAPTPSMCDSPMGSPCPSDMYDGNLSLYEIDPHEVSMVTTDACGKLKTAFLFHLRRDMVACRNIVEDLFPMPVPLSPRREDEERDVDSVLDRTVVRIAREMLDDIPAGDPRWKQRPGGLQTNICLGSSSALQIMSQLKDKQRAYCLFVEFLRAVGLWHRLQLLSKESGGGCISTQQVLGSLAEQLTIALTLRKLQQGPLQQLIDAKIYQVVCGENPDIEEDPEVEQALSSGALSPSDVFYRRVTGVTRVVTALARSQPNTSDNRQAAKLVLDTLTVLNSVLSEVVLCRSQWHCAPAPVELGPKRLLPHTADLIKRAYDQYGRNCPDQTLRSQVFETAAALSDIVLSLSHQLSLSPHTLHIYERMRNEAVRAPMEQGQTERAAALAEKYKAFDLLIEMCVKADDMERLYQYIDKYANEGIAETAFAWLSEHSGTNSAQLIRSLGSRYPTRLTNWLAKAQQRAPLLALHHLSARDYSSAAIDLVQLALEETESVGRMSTMASLAKLCLLASDEENQPEDLWNKVSNRLALAEQHSALPRDVRIHHGLDTEDTRVMSADELVQMYIESESKSLTEYDYKKALDLTDFIKDMERRDDLRLRVWCACIKRDSWSQCRVDAPRQELQDKMFFRLVDLVHLMGGDLELLLPPVEDIMTAPELAELVSDPKFHFLIKYGYECVDTTRSTAMD